MKTVTLGKGNGKLM